MFRRFVLRCGRHGELEWHVRRHEVGRHPLAASFAQQNGSLSGTLTISSGWLCSVASQGNVSGSVDGTQVQASATFGLAAALSFTGNVTGNTMSGTYEITSGVCAGGSGSFSLSH